ncbi:MAG: metalloregulator ArsR/SmtB family transcription factor [Pseudomonadota bacterium]
MSSRARAAALGSQADTHMSREEAAQAFAAIGSETRLDVLRALVRAGPQGLSVGQIQERLDVAASTLTHHLKFLSAAGLIRATKTGRTITNCAAYDRLDQLARFLMSECCSEAHAAHSAEHAHAVSATKAPAKAKPKSGAVQ